MFQTIKQNVSLIDVISKDLNVEFKSAGSSNMEIADEKDNGGCPFCSHNGCFKVKVPSDEDNDQFYHCFSCGKHGDVISWRVERAGGEDVLSPKDAAVQLAKEYNIHIPRGNSNPIQEVFNQAARYYHLCLLENCNQKYPELGGLTPLEYQTQIRGHSEDILKRMQVGFSDGGLRDFLEGVGFDEQILLDSGLIVKKKDQKFPRDFLPSKCFIYPHKVKKQVSHFTFKDPLKRIAYQLPKKFSLNGYSFYGQDTISESDVVLVVEGENDLITSLDAGAPAVIATIGQLSADQLNWMRENLSDKKVVTCFDGDDAGDKYRKKVELNRRYYLNLAHVRPPQDSDIDDQIRKSGKTVAEVIKEGLTKVELTREELGEKPTLDVPWETPDRPSPMVLPTVTKLPEKIEKTEKVEAEEVPEDKPASMQDLVKNSDLAIPSGKQVHVVDDETVEMENNPVIQHKGCYWRLKMNDGVPDYVRISDFTIRLKNVFLNESGDRHREILVVKQNGYVSDPILVDSETKTSLKSFKVMLARAADAEWIGTEMDMAGMWKLVYGKDPDVLVRVPRMVGRHERYGCWIFRNLLVTDSGTVITPDDDNIFWVNGKSLGIRPESLNVASSKDENANGDIPYIENSLSREETEKMLGDAIHNLSRNLNGEKGMPGYALLMMGWAWASVYADLIFKLNRGFPFLMLWGTNGKGKTTLGKWLQYFFGTAEHGSTSVPQLKSGVGWSRKAGYYSNLPLMIDEVRANDETRQFLGTFRAYYDREDRTMGTKAEFGVRTQSVRAGFIFCGEDQFEDPATRERCIPVRIPAIGRETEESYRWFQEHMHLFSNITYYRILDWCKADKPTVVQRIQEMDKRLINAGCPSRTSKNWAAVGIFAKELAKVYIPDFDFEKWLIEACINEVTTQREDTTLSQFFELVEGTMAQENSRIGNQHIMTEGKYLHIWFPPVYKIVADECRGKFPFSKSAVASALKEETYFVSDTKKVSMGVEGVRRLVITLDLDKCPDIVKNIAKVN